MGILSFYEKLEQGLGSDQKKRIYTEPEFRVLRVFRGQHHAPRPS